MLGLDLFCGGGGMTYGLRAAGIRVVCGVDVDARCASTYVRNNPGTKYHLANVKTANPAELVPGMVLDRSEPLVLSASPPCQPFSIANRYKRTDDPNSGMSQAILSVVRLAGPDYVVIENVPMFRHHPDWEMLRDGLVGAGYNVSSDVENLSRYGVPQHRRRFVAVATTVRSNASLQPAPTGRTMTVRDAIGGMPDTPDHQQPAYQIALMSALPKDGGTVFDVPEALRPPCRRGGTRHYSHSRMYWDQPAWTVTAKYDIGSSRAVHPEFNRLLTVTERARLQTFPDGYFRVDASSSRRFCHHMMGNAVPPLYAFILGGVLLEHHQKSLYPTSYLDGVVTPPPKPAF